MGYLDDTLTKIIVRTRKVFLNGFGLNSCSKTQQRNLKRMKRMIVNDPSWPVLA